MHKNVNLPTYPNTTHTLTWLTFFFLNSSLLPTRLFSLRIASRMITSSVFLSLVCLVVVVSASDGNESDGCSGTANYVLSFYGLWKQDRHPKTTLPNIITRIFLIWLVVLMVLTMSCGARVQKLLLVWNQWQKTGAQNSIPSLSNSSGQGG